MGTWFLERNLKPRYGYIGANREGCGGLGEQIPYQGLDPSSIHVKVKVGVPLCKRHTHSLLEVAGAYEVNYTGPTCPNVQNV